MKLHTKFSLNPVTRAGFTLVDSLSLSRTSCVWIMGVVLDWIESEAHVVGVSGETCLMTGIHD